MNEKAHLERIAQQFAELRLDAVMIGNAAAAINGAPVTTLDIDFMLKHTDENYRKLAVLAQRMECQFIEIRHSREQTGGWSPEGYGNYPNFGDDPP